MAKPLESKRYPYEYCPSMSDLDRLNGEVRRIASRQTVAEA
ncbi:MAG TPA: hypothetical protein VIU40_03120 [Geobacteraceae bacterium]